MSFVVDGENQGTPESIWLSAMARRNVAEWVWGNPSRIVVISPHPDDEVLAMGGSLRRLAQQGCRIDIIAVTRGEASHPESRVSSRADIPLRRTHEREKALSILGLRDVRTVELFIPDGSVSANRELIDRLAPLVRGAEYCLAPWAHDGHPDHDACGQAAFYACFDQGVRLLEYIVWGWHWATPSALVFPWERLRSIPLSKDDLIRKSSAIEAYQSQIHPLAPDEPKVVLPPYVLKRFHRRFEAVFQ